MYENVKVEISRLYRVLNEMLRAGLLEDHWEKSRLGPGRRIYRLSDRGRKELHEILLEAIETVHSFYGHYLMNLPEEVSVFNKICKLLSDNLHSRGKIVYIASKYSGTQEIILRCLHSKIPQGKIYLVMPSLVDFDLNLNNLLRLEGDYDDIPLRDGYVDLVVVAGIPEKVSLEVALKEWRRVLGRSGILAFATPAVIVHKYEDPMTIGDFVEKCEHELIEKDEQIVGESLRSLFENFFQKVEERKIVHITVFLAS